MREEFVNAVKGLYPKSYNDKVRVWLNDRYGTKDAETIWNRIQENYLQYLEDLPEMGGKKYGHASAIYGGLLIFALYQHCRINRRYKSFRSLFRSFLWSLLQNWAKYLT